MAKISVAAAPTFKATVEIPAPEGKSLKIEFIFKHRTRKALDAWQSELRPAEGAPRSDTDVVMDTAEGWTNVDEPFGRESIEALCDNYHAAGGVIATKYLEELMQARRGN